MSELQITFGGQLYRYGPGTGKIGRSMDNDIVVSEPTVSRKHAQLTFGAGGWTWQNAGQAPTFLRGQPVASFSVADLADITLGSPQGPAIRIQVVPDAVAPVKTELAGPALVAELAAPAPAGAAASPAAAAAPAAAASPAPVAPAAPPAPGYAPPQQPGYPAPAPGYPAPQPGYAAPQPGYPPPAYPPPGAIAQPGYPPPGAVPAPGMPGWPAAPPPGQLVMGSFFQTLVPIKSWLHDKGWRQGLRLLIIPYALLPLIFVQLFSMSANLATPGWTYGIYIAPLWLLAFWYLIRPPRWGWLETGIAIGIVIWEFIWLHVVTLYIANHLETGTLTFPKALIVGYNEEISKAIPVLVAAALLLAVFKQKRDPRTWMLMGTISGLTFGVIEQSIYTPAALEIILKYHQFSQAAVLGELEFAFRVFVDGFQHAVWAGISGFFIGLAINYRRRRIPLLLLGISIPAVLHALNDWTLTIFAPSVWFTVIVIQGTSLLLFLGYTLSAEQIERRVRRNPAFRGQSILMERFTEPGPAPGT
jgi:RsiW-degrading membrane proteinase PrsW (M82 family)